MEANANGVNGKGNAGKSDAATAQFPAAISNGSSNRLKSDCQDPSVMNDASCEGTTFHAKAKSEMYHSSTDGLVEVSEDDQLSRSTMSLDGAPTGFTGSSSLKVDNTGNDKTASKGSNEPDNVVGTSSTDQDVMASSEGIKFYSVNDVLCGRGGGTNVHPGNRRFRDLVNANRRAYLKAKKNDKPTISRSVVHAIRKMNGRFLKKDDNKDLWFEIGDDCAREKTSQALRQRAPEMRKFLHEDEQRQQQQQAEQQMILRHHQHQVMAMAGGGRGVNFPQMNAFAGIGGGFNPSSFGQGGNVLNSDLSQTLLATYNNMLQQRNVLAQQEQNMIFQRLSMPGINPYSMNAPSQNQMDSSRIQALLQHGFNPVVTRGA